MNKKKKLILQERKAIKTIKIMKKGNLNKAMTHQINDLERINSLMKISSN